MDEFAFIAALRSMSDNPVARGLQDDAAVYGDLVITHDMMVEGTHYFPDADPADVAWKLVVRNLSDLAAKGATPLGVLLGYIIGDDAWDRRFVDGLSTALSHFGTMLWGGDTSSAASPAPRVLGMTAIGRASHVPVPSRSGASAGDAVWIAGIIGDAYMGWAALADRANPAPSWQPSNDQHRTPRDRNPALWRFETAFLRPLPMLTEGALLAPQVTAIMDISDGVLLDAQRMAKASAATFDIDFAALPFSAELRDTAASVGDGSADGSHQHDLLMRAATFGDDYALLFTLPPGQSPPCPATCVGRVGEHRAGTPLLVDGQPPDPTMALGWQHHG